MDSSATNPKKERATHEQLEVYVCFCQAHPEISKGKNNPKSPQQMQDLWKQLAEELNACRGPSRSVVKWKETLGVWKSQLRKRARRLKMDQRLTGGGPSGKPMSDFEEKALATFGSAAVDGVDTIESLGLGLQCTQNIESLPIELVIPTTENILLSPLPSCSSVSLANPQPLPSLIPSPSPVPSASPERSTNPASSTCVLPSFSPENQSDMNSEASTSRLSRGERNKLIRTLIANIAKRNAAEEHTRHREEEQRQEHREVIQSIQSLTSTVAELINVLKKNSSQ